MKSEFKKAGTLQLTGIRRIDGELLCVRDAGADAADGVCVCVCVCERETRELMQRMVDICGDQCGYCGWLLSHHILLVLQFLNVHA